MIIAISSTATLGEQNFQKTKDVIESVVKEYGRERIHYGVVLFGSKPQIAVHLGVSYDTDEELMAMLNSFDRDTGSADVAKVRLSMRICMNNERTEHFCILTLSLSKTLGQ